MKFSWFGEQEHRVFNYRPIYYDEQKEELRKKFGQVDGSLDKDAKEGNYVPGSYIQGSFRDGNYSKTRGDSKVSAVISLVGLVIFVVVLIMITRFYGML